MMVWTITSTVALAPGVRLGRVQLTFEPAVQVTPAEPLADTSTALPGTVSVRETLVWVPAPLLDTVSWKSTFCPAVTVEPEFCAIPSAGGGGEPEHVPEIGSGLRMFWLNHMSQITVCGANVWSSHSMSS